MNLKELILQASLMDQYKTDRRPFIFTTDNKLYRSYKPVENMIYVAFSVSQLSSMSAEMLEDELNELRTYKWNLNLKNSIVRNVKKYSIPGKSDTNHNM